VEEMKSVEKMKSIEQAVRQALLEVEKSLPLKYDKFEATVIQKLREHLSQNYSQCDINRTYGFPYCGRNFTSASVDFLSVDMWNDEMHFKVYCKGDNDEANLLVVLRTTIMKLHKYKLLGFPPWKEEIETETIVPVIHSYWIEC
jgi:hypothetical protein